MKQFLFFSTLLLSFSVTAQNKMTPELLWKLGRVSALGISKDGKYILYSVGTPNAAENKSSRKKYAIPVTGGNPIPVSNADSMLTNEKISPDGKYIISNAEVKLCRPAKIECLHF
jgi:Tol biopolymer transport system component